MVGWAMTASRRAVQLSGSVNLSAGYFCHAFKKGFGVSPHAYVMAKRVERAQRMMLTTDESLSQIAVSCGLADQSHLSRVLRRALGYSPSTWRRHCRNNLSGAIAGAGRQAGRCFSLNAPNLPGP